MTRAMFKVLVGAVLVGLTVSPLGLAQADPVGSGANGVTLEYPLPTVGTPTLTVTVNGNPTPISGSSALGGTLRISFLAGEWHVSETHGDAACDPGEVGKTVSLNGTSPTATLEAYYMDARGDTTGIPATSAPGKNPHFDASFCTGV